MKALVIIPAYNEAANIERTVDSLQGRYDYIVINDGSTDSTEVILKEKRFPHVELVRNLGIGGAVQTGYKFAHLNGYDIAIQFDGDGQHDAGYIAKLIEPIESGRADIVIGSRFVGEESEFKSSGARRVGIKILSSLLKLATGQRVKDVTSGFRAVNARGIELFAENYPSDYPEPESIAMSIVNGLTVEEIPVAMHARTGGVSSIGGFNTVWYMVKVGLSIMLRGSYRNRRS